MDVRLISATNKDLKQEVAAGRFREDLFYRISVVPLEIPPLRERLADIPLLVEHILEEEARRSDRRRDPARAPRKVSVARETLALLLAHRWPGNIRELQNVLRFALIKCKGNLLGPEHLPPTFAVPAPDSLQDQGAQAEDHGRMRRQAPWSRPGDTRGRRLAAWACPGQRSTGTCRGRGSSARERASLPRTVSRLHLFRNWVTRQPFPAPPS